MKHTHLPAGTVATATAANVLPFKKVISRTISEPTQQCLDLLEKLKAQILAGEESPTGLVLCVIENSGQSEKSFALSTGLSRMELIGNLYALATEITVEQA